jgi:hypothetical protein
VPASLRHRAGPWWKPDDRAARYPALIEHRDRKRVADADEVGEIHQGPDRRKLALLDQAPQERLGRRAVLRRIDAEAAEHPAPGRKRGQLAEGRAADPVVRHHGLAPHGCSESRWRWCIVDSGCKDDATDDRREARGDTRVIAEARHVGESRTRSRRGPCADGAGCRADHINAATSGGIRSIPSGVNRYPFPRP